MSIASASESIDVQLQRPFSVGGRPVGRLAVWLLAAIAWRAREGGQGLVDAHEVAAHLRSPAALPMALSRLFNCLEPIGLALGWGGDIGAPPETLALRGRSRGPFWLGSASLSRLRFRMGERAAGAAELRRFAGLGGAPLSGAAHPGAHPAVTSGATAATSAATPAQAGVPDDLDRWYALLDARQRSEEEAASTRGAPSLQSLAELRLAPHERLARAWSRFYAARNARRAGDIDAARRGLRALVREMGSRVTDPREQVALALARIGLVWCDHQARRLAHADAGLRALSLEAEGPEGAVWRVNSRIACEFLNLRALVLRARLAQGSVPAAARPALVRRVLADLREALICATESDAFTLIESVAANLGYTLWLLEAWLPSEVARQGPRLEAIRWILLSEWLCQRHGLAAGSPWNLINVCRVARGAGQTPGAGSAPTLPLARMREKVGLTATLLGAPKQVRDWIDLTALLADSALAAPSEYTPPQQAAALVEHCWQLAAAGRPAEFEQCRQQALRRLPALTAMDRGFFRHELEAAAALAGMR